MELDRVRQGFLQLLSQWELERRGGDILFFNKVVSFIHRLLKFHYAIFVMLKLQTGLLMRVKTHR